MVLSPKNLVSDVYDIKRTKGFSGIPITDNGQIGGKLLGIITARDIDFVPDDKLDQSIASVMTPLDKLVTAKSSITINEANRLLEESKKGKLPVVNSNGNLEALISRAGKFIYTDFFIILKFIMCYSTNYFHLDLKENRDFPQAMRDSQNRLLVGAAIGTRDDDKARLKL